MDRNGESVDRTNFHTATLLQTEVLAVEAFDFSNPNPRGSFTILRPIAGALASFL